MRKINEIFYSIQGEGRNTGRAAIFIRFSGCNLRCPFCDTQHNEGRFMSNANIFDEVSKYKCELVVITGGEPSLFLDEAFIDGLHLLGKEVAVETNGTHKLPNNIDFVTLSPKFEFVDNGEVVLRECDELKVVWCGDNDMSRYESIPAEYRYLQPCDTGDKSENERIIKEVVAYCKANPEWRVSLQTQKILNVR